MEIEIDPCTALLDMDCAIFSQLASLLDQKNAWRKVADFFNIFKHNEIYALSIDSTPGRRLLYELGIRMCNIQTLAIVLRECHLYEVLALIAKTEALQIRKQPSDALNGSEKLKIPIGDPLELEFDVVGIPPPTFTWYKDNNIVVGQENNKLCIQNYTPIMEGDYYCCATRCQHGEIIDEIYSKEVTVTTLPSKCVVIEKPEEFMNVREGSSILMKLKVVAYPKPEYIWTHHNVILIDENKDVLYIPKCTSEHGGEYKCLIRNTASEVIITVTVVIQAENTFEYFKGTVTGKYALLIGNDKYRNLEHLSAPKNDVVELSKILNQLGFQTINFCNLDLREMEMVIELFAGSLQKGAYAFFYYVGHGFEHGDKYLMPIDCPDDNSFMKKDAISESLILNKVLEMEPTLFVLLLDMCLKAPDRLETDSIFNERTTIMSYKSKRNLIRGYSTTSHLAAYESIGKSNGVYVNILKKYLGQYMPVLTILGKVNAEMSDLCPDQMPNISYITDKNFYLSNPSAGDDKNGILYENLDIKTINYVCFDTTLTLQKYKNVFHNALELLIENGKRLKYKCNCDNITQLTPSENETILIIEDIQKLTNGFEISFQINETHDFKIKKSFPDLCLLSQES